MYQHKNILLKFMTCTLLAGCGSQEAVSPVVPRPDPDTKWDPIAAQVIRSKAQLLVGRDQDPKVWKEYGDACLMNRWPEEAVVAYTQALFLGESCGMHLAHALRRTGSIEAFPTAIEYLRANDDSECCLTLAIWYLEDGELDQAEKWIGMANDERSPRRIAANILLEIQRGNYEGARTILDPLLGSDLPDYIAPMALQIARSIGDQELMSQFDSTQSTGSVIPNGPLLQKIQRLDRTKDADHNRALLIHKVCPPSESIPRLAALIEQRPGDAFLRSILADVFFHNQQLTEAKAVLDVVYDNQPTDSAFWFIDSLVHEKLSRAGSNAIAQLDRAEASAAEAIRLNPMLPESFMAAAQAAESRGDYLTAEGHWRKAAELSPNTEVALKLKAAAWRNVSLLGEPNRAADALLALAEEAGQHVPEVQLEAAVAAHLAGRLDIASELSQLLDATYRSIYEGRIR